jgi:hypothetical protein
MPFEILREVVFFVIASSNLFLTFPCPFHASVSFLGPSLTQPVHIFILRMAQFWAQNYLPAVCEHRNWIEQHITRIIIELGVFGFQNFAVF